MLLKTDRAKMRGGKASVTWGRRSWVQFFDMMKNDTKDGEVINITLTKDEMEKLIQLIEK